MNHDSNEKKDSNEKAEVTENSNKAQKDGS